MERYAFVIQGQATNWYYKPLKQAVQIARKEKGLSFALFNLLKKTKSILYHKEILENGHWIRKVNNSEL